MSGCAKFLASRPFQDHGTTSRRRQAAENRHVEQKAEESSSGGEQLVRVRDFPF